ARPADPAARAIVRHSRGPRRLHGGDLREFRLRRLPPPARRENRGAARHRRPRQEYHLGNPYRDAERAVPAAVSAPPAVESASYRGDRKTFAPSSLPVPIRSRPRADLAADIQLASLRCLVTHRHGLAILVRGP